MSDHARKARCVNARAANVRVGARGFALVPALFLIVVLGALAVIAVRVGTGQQQAVTMSLEEARALAAAQAGIEWGAGFTVTVTCTASTFANGAATANSYVLKATAVIGTYGQPGYVRRVVSGTYSSAT